MIALRSALLPLVAVVLTPAEVHGQSAQAISLQVSGLYNTVDGDVFDNLKNGFGGEAQIRYTPGALSVGAGFQYTEHGAEPVSGFMFPDVRLYGGFVEPRYRIHTGSYVIAPYVSARFSLLKAGFEGGEFSLSSTFIQLNGGGGLLYRLGPRLNLDAGATFGYNRRSAGTLSRNGEEVQSDPAASGVNLVLRLGLAVGLGG
ncbi:MAG TPA: outer membrane beta-barrel protein [Gemmatimonadales bacterium]|nr:outer membrane beta-barrel protein [Gemmatimonadales bacterium]